MSDLTWRREPPDSEGYWWVDVPGKPPAVREVYRDSFGGLCLLWPEDREVASDTVNEFCNSHPDARFARCEPPKD